MCAQRQDWHRFCLFDIELVLFLNYISFSNFTAVWSCQRSSLAYCYQCFWYDTQYILKCNTHFEASFQAVRLFSKIWAQLWGSFIIVRSFIKHIARIVDTLLAYICSTLKAPISRRCQEYTHTLYFRLHKVSNSWWIPSQSFQISYFIICWLKSEIVRGNRKHWCVMEKIFRYQICEIDRCLLIN
jgi:hypothetical protein